MMSLLGQIGILDIKDKYPNEISGGQKQRVGIARALMNDPLILLADEPTGNLDSKASNSVIEAFRDANQSFGTTIFMVTHDTVAASHSDRVIIMEDGMVVDELIRQGSSHEFLNEILTFMQTINGGGSIES